MANKTDNDQPAKGVLPIRAVGRAIQVLQIINRRGNPTIMEIKEESRLAYPTVFRMVMTLLHEGLIECESSRKRYRPTELVWSLVAGFQERDKLVPKARPFIQELTSKVYWPVAISVRVGDRMMVKDSTHAMTTQTFTNYYPGFCLPISDCAAGKAYIAFCSDEERNLIFASKTNAKTEGQRLATMIVKDEAYLDRIREQGYAINARNAYTDRGRTSSIAVPVLHEGAIKACMTLIFFERAMTMDKAVATYVDLLKATVQKITDALSRA